MGEFKISICLPIDSLKEASCDDNLRPRGNGPPARPRDGPTFPSGESQPERPQHQRPSRPPPRPALPRTSPPTRLCPSFGPIDLNVTLRGTLRLKSPGPVCRVWAWKARLAARVLGSCPILTPGHARRDEHVGRGARPAGHSYDTGRAALGPTRRDLPTPPYFSGLFTCSRYKSMLH